MSVFWDVTASDLILKFVTSFVHKKELGNVRSVSNVCCCYVISSRFDSLMPTSGGGDFGGRR
jgi:hypothetical protein